MTAKADAPLNLGRRSHLALFTRGPVPYAPRVTVREACAARGVSVYRLAMSGHAQGTVDAGTVYRLARGDTSRIDLHTLATLAGILHTLTGEAVAVSDLLSLEVSGDAVARWELEDVRRWKSGQRV